MAYSEKQKRQYFAITNQLTGAERELIRYYDIQWHLKNRVPTLEEVTEFVRKKYPTTRHTSINYYLNRPPVKKALKDRKIPYLEHTQEELTATQLAVAVTMMNFADTRPNNEKLDSLGVTPDQYNAWLKDPNFKNALDNLSEQNVQSIKPVAVTELTKKIHAGDWPALKFYLETSGAVANNDAPDPDAMLRMVIEVLQRHVKDGATLMAIAQDLKAVSQNRLPTRTIEAEVLPYTTPTTFEQDFSAELESAKRQIGFS